MTNTVALTANKVTLISDFLKDIFEVKEGWEVKIEMGYRRNSAKFVRVADSTVACTILFFRDDFSFFQRVIVGGAINYSNIEPIEVAGTVAKNIIKTDFGNPDSQYRQWLKTLENME